MPGKQKDNLLSPVSPVSPVLFMTVDGDPMSFYLRPGPIKRRYQPLITAGGGTLCNIQQPGAILLIDPEEKTSIPESTVHWYVSTQYIQDCVEKNEQLDPESYRLNPEVIQRRSSRHSSKDISPRPSGGRMPYTSEDDAAILNYVSKHRARTGGNTLWQEMKKQGVTGHSWQSMKHRYKSQLAKNLTEDEEEKTPDDEKVEEDHPEMEGNQDPNAQKASTEEEDDDDNVSLHTCFSNQELIQNPQDGEQNWRTESTQVLEKEKEPKEAAETFSVQMTEPAEEAETETTLVTSEASQPDKDPDLTTQIDNSNEDSPSSQCETLIKASPSTKIKEKQKAPPTMETPQRPITQRQLKESLSPPEPYSRRLRNHSSSSTPMSSPLPSPRTSRKTRAPVTASPEECTTTKQPLTKKPRADDAAETQQETMDVLNPETTNTAPSKTKKKKKQLGILELAAMEFDDESELDKDEDSDLQSPSKGVAMLTEAPIISTPQSEPELEDKILEEEEQEEEAEQEEEVELDEEAEPEASSSISVSKAEHPQPAAAEPSASKAHLFIFDSESQAEVVSDDHPVAPPTEEAAALSLTQSQLEEDMSRIRELMNHTDQDLATVTKALLKTSGDFSAAQNLLLKPSQVSGPFWNRYDDAGLLSANIEVRRGLQEKYGEQEVAKRIVFLEVEG